MACGKEAFKVLASVIEDGGPGSLLLHELARPDDLLFAFALVTDEFDFEITWPELGGRRQFESEAGIVGGKFPDLLRGGREPVGVGGSLPLARSCRLAAVGIKMKCVDLGHVKTLRRLAVHLAGQAMGEQIVAGHFQDQWIDVDQVDRADTCQSDRVAADAAAEISDSPATLISPGLVLRDPLAGRLLQMDSGKEHGLRCGKLVFSPFPKFMQLHQATCGVGFEVSPESLDDLQGGQAIPESRRNRHQMLSCLRGKKPVREVYLVHDKGGCRFRESPGNLVWIGKTLQDREMSQPIDLLATYLHLAKAAWKRRQMQDRDRLLVISGFIATRMKLERISNHCRKLILENNPGHMIRKWQNFAVAIEDSDFQHFLKQMQRRFPQEKAEVLLANLGIDRANEKQLYLDEEEYAAAVIGADFDDEDE